MVVKNPTQTRRGPQTTISGFIPTSSYTHLQPWLNRVCWGYNYLISRGPFLKVMLMSAVANGNIPGVHGSLGQRCLVLLADRWGPEALDIPIGSMYGMFTYIYHKNQLNVGKYTMDGMGLDLFI